MSEEATCGKGLAANAALPAKLGDVMHSVARVLESHTKALDLEDDSARQEYNAYVRLVEQHRRMAAELHALGQEMVSYRDLPMGRHDAEAMSTSETADVFEDLVNVEQELLSVLEERLREHRPLLSQMRGAARA